MSTLSGRVRRARRTTHSKLLFEALLLIEAAIGSAAIAARGFGRRAEPRPKAKEGRFVGIVSEVILWIGALLGTVAILITAASAAYGVRPVIIKSGSMEPSIETGAVLLARAVDSSDLSIGDVVSVTRPDGVRVTHRIVGIQDVGDTREFVLKGDANEEADPLPLRIDRSYKVIAKVPEAGWVAHYSATPLGGFALGISISAALLLPGRFRRGRRADLTAAVL